jgi:hypothetical protein
MWAIIIIIIIIMITIIIINWWRWAVRFMPGHFAPREGVPGTHCMGVSVGPKAGLNAVKKKKSLAPGRNWNPIPRSSQYPLNYTDSLVHDATGLTHDKNLHIINNTLARSALNECTIGWTRIFESLHILPSKIKRIAITFGFGKCWISLKLHNIY